MKSTYLLIQPKSIKSGVFIFSVLTIVSMAALMYTGEPLVTKQTPRGIISYELAGNTAKTNMILDSWKPSQKMFAAFNLGLDYLYLIAYSHLIALLCIIVGITLSQKWEKVANRLTGLIMLAALLDATENFGLLMNLFGSQNDLWPGLANWCAVLKFTFVGLGILYVLSGSIILLYRKIKG